VPSADEIVVAWPEEIEVDADTAVISLVHEERLDIPALRAGVEGGAFYVGALGSRRAQEKRRAHLGELADAVHGPVGLDLGGEGPAEIALEILAEILQTRKTGAAPAASPEPSPRRAPDRPGAFRRCTERPVRDASATMPTQHDVQPVVGPRSRAASRAADDADQPPSVRDAALIR
jgi:hypothetical protein